MNLYCHPMMNSVYKIFKNYIILFSHIHSAEITQMSLVFVLGPKRFIAVLKNMWLEGWIELSYSNKTTIQLKIGQKLWYMKLCSSVGKAVSRDITGRPTDVLSFMRALTGSKHWMTRLLICHCSAPLKSTTLINIYVIYWRILLGRIN